MIDLIKPNNLRKFGKGFIDIDNYVLNKKSSKFEI